MQLMFDINFSSTNEIKTYFCAQILKFLFYYMQIGVKTGGLTLKISTQNQFELEH